MFYIDEFSVMCQSENLFCKTVFDNVDCFLSIFVEGTKTTYNCNLGAL